MILNRGFCYYISIRRVALLSNFLGHRIVKIKTACTEGVAAVISEVVTPEAGAVPKIILSLKKIFIIKTRKKTSRQKELLVEIIA